RGRVVGLFDSNESAALDALVTQAKRLALPSWVRALPTVNASLNALCAILLVVGWTLIRRRASDPQSRGGPENGPMRTSSSSLANRFVRSHIACMVLAVLTSA